MLQVAEPHHHVIPRDRN